MLSSIYIKLLDMIESSYVLGFVKAQKKMTATQMAPHFGIQAQQMRKYLRGDSGMSADTFFSGVKSLGYGLALVPDGCMIK